MIILQLIFLLDYFQYFYLLDLYAFTCLLILSGLKVKNYLKINILTCFALDLVVITKNIRVIKS